MYCWVIEKINTLSDPWFSLDIFGIKSHSRIADLLMTREVGGWLYVCVERVLFRNNKLHKHKSKSTNVRMFAHFNPYLIWCMNQHKCDAHSFHSHHSPVIIFDFGIISVAFGRMKTGKLLFFVGHGINVFEVLTFGRTIAAVWIPSKANHKCHAITNAFRKVFSWIYWKY